MEKEEYYTKKYSKLLNQIETFFKDKNISNFDKDHAAISFICTEVAYVSDSMEDGIKLFKIAQEEYEKRRKVFDKMLEDKKRRDKMN